MSENKRQMWQFPWKYRESIAITLGILLVGFLLQITLGSFDFFLLHSPVNLVLGAIIILLAIALSFAKQNPIVQWLGGVPLSVVVLGGLLVMSIPLQSLIIF